MSKEKLYAIKSNDGEWADSHYTFGSGAWATPYKAKREEDAKHHGGHVVAFVEEPKEVVLTKEQAKIVEDARDGHHPASVLRFSGKDDEELLMNAYVNGYTVAKEKKYNVKVPQTQTSYYYKGSDGHVHASDTSGGLDNQFSDYELQQYGLDGERFTKEEVTDDDK